MKTLLASAAILGLATSAALGAEHRPVMLTDSQMDKITAGALINVLVLTGDIASGNAVLVQIPVNAGVCAVATCVQNFKTDNLGTNKLLNRH